MQWRRATSDSEVMTNVHNVHGEIVHVQNYFLQIFECEKMISEYRISNYYMTVRLQVIKNSNIGITCLCFDKNCSDKIVLTRLRYCPLYEKSNERDKRVHYATIEQMKKSDKATPVPLRSNSTSESWVEKPSASRT